MAQKPSKQLVAPEESKMADVRPEVIPASLEESQLHPVGGAGLSTRKNGPTQFLAIVPTKFPLRELLDWLVGQAGSKHIRIHEFSYRGHEFFIQGH